MKFISTRGQTPPLGFSDAVATGLAPDGGLFLPETLPDALGELERDATVLGWLPEPMRLAYFALKRTEMARVKDLDAAAQCARYADVY